MTKLLVSVRSVPEAHNALAGGADIIDIKEPTNGSLGRADDDVICQIVEFSRKHRVPVSAAFGELLDDPASPPASLDYAKVGLAGVADHNFDRWRRWQRTVHGAVLVAYADMHDVEKLAMMANEVDAAAFLIDTAFKDGKTLLDHLPIGKLRSIRRQVRIPFAVAGSLKDTIIDDILPIRPDFVAVRGAVCRGGRDGQVDSELVRELASRLARFSQSP